MKIVAVSVLDCPASRAKREVERAFAGTTPTLLGLWAVQVTIRPLSTTGCLYQDEIELDAGPLTPVLAVGIRGFLWLRQRRWSALSRSWGTNRPVEW